MAESMNEPDWRESVRSYIRREALPVDKFGHQARLYALAVKIAEGEGCDDDILFAAAWMHDIGVFLGHRPSDPAALAKWDHVPYTIEKTGEMLNVWGFPAEKLNAVCEVIRTHQPKDVPQSQEATVLRDADILEQLGAIGALRAFVKVGRDTRFCLFSDVVPVLERAVRELPGKLLLPQSKLLAEVRVQTLRDFLQAIQFEAGELLY
ncbi:HD domain-containing protein [Acidicapsa dinghuensis]|uniref:HD domain-containing protein n=1 Tax=Acidicapsa dinghuensis TaxID=2218256 RepID=A0ABW1EGF0_9BACT|nr:HD domain-containing protein [Acidicapsa dinghuensis]